jgi:hexosaminidase
MRHPPDVCLLACLQVCAWDDAAQTDSGDLVVSISPYVMGVSEAWWSPQAFTNAASPDGLRLHLHRCRIIQRGIPSHPIFAFSTYCYGEWEAQLPPWEQT